MPFLHFQFPWIFLLGCISSSHILSSHLKNHFLDSLVFLSVRYFQTQGNTKNHSLKNPHRLRKPPIQKVTDSVTPVSSSKVTFNCLGVSSQPTTLVHPRGFFVAWLVRYDLEIPVNYHHVSSPSPANLQNNETWFFRNNHRNEPLWNKKYMETNTFAEYEQRNLRVIHRLSSAGSVCFSDFLWVVKPANSQFYTLVEDSNRCIQ